MTDHHNCNCLKISQSWNFGRSDKFGVFKPKMYENNIVDQNQNSDKDKVKFYISDTK